MKKIFLFMALCVMLALSACGNESKTIDATPNPVLQTEAPTTEPTKAPDMYIYASSGSKSASEWTEVKSFSYDMDNDGSKEKVRLITSAQKDSKERLVIDDSQNWVVEMQDNGEIFTLLDEKISNGCPYFEIAEDSETDAKYLRVLISSSAKFVNKNYMFLNDKRAFVEVESPKTQNTIYSSIPYYE